MNKNMDLHNGLTPKEERDLVLEAAARLIETKGWATKAAARDADGIVVDWNSPRACSFCLGAAIARGTRDYDVSLLASEWATQAVERVTRLSIISWNDGFAENATQVVQVLREAKEQGL